MATHRPLRGPLTYATPAEPPPHTVEEIPAAVPPDEVVRAAVMSGGYANKVEPPL